MSCNNYRGITVGTTMAKVYATVPNNKLSEWTEKYRCRAQAQAEFRKDHRCLDNIFILRTVGEKYRGKGAKLYCCFVDFSKAFDECPVYQHVGVKYAELLESAHDLKSLFRCASNRVGRLIHECYLVHKKLALQP
jgi:hypothetical protein